MPDRPDFIEDLFGVYSQNYSVQDTGMHLNSATVPSGHYATPQEMIETPEEGAFRDNDPVFSEAEKFLAGMLAADKVVDYPLPIVGSITSGVISTAPVILRGASVIPTTDCTMRLYDTANLSFPVIQLALSGPHTSTTISGQTISSAVDNLTFGSVVAGALIETASSYRVVAVVTNNTNGVVTIGPNATSIFTTLNAGQSFALPPYYAGALYVVSVTTAPTSGSIDTYRQTATNTTSTITEQVGSNTSFGRVFFPHGLYVSVSAGSLTGGFIIERHLDSIPK